MNFIFDEYVMQIRKVNNRVEKHGAEKVPAGDVIFFTSMPNDRLSMIHEDLPELLYKKKENEQGDDLVQQSQEGQLTDLRIANMEMPIKFNISAKGYDISLHVGEHVIELEDCKISGIEVSAAEGGAVELKFKAAFQTDEYTFGSVCFLQEQKIPISITPPENNTLGLQ